MTTTVTAPAPTGSSWPVWGTRAHLEVTDPAALPEARTAMVAELAAVDATCSRFRADSELRSLDTSGGRESPVSPLLAEALDAALRAAALTDGDVDPTLGTVLCGLGYDRDFAEVAGHADPRPVTVRTVPGWRTVRLDRTRRTLRVPAGTLLDLGATAKAWAADRIARHLADRFGVGTLVSLGGDVAVAGTAPEGGWRVRVQETLGDPEDAPHGAHQVVTLASGGVATSSTAARRWVRGGQLLHHIVDPRTALPAAPVWRTVTVAAATCLDANAASTAAVVRGEAAPDWLGSLRLPARLVSADGEVTRVAGWPTEVAA